MDRRGKEWQWWQARQDQLGKCRVRRAWCTCRAHTCSASRRARSAAFFGESPRTMASSPAQNRAGPTEVPDASRAHVSRWMRLPRHRGRRAQHTWQDVLFDERDEAWMDAQVSKLLILDHSCGARGAPGTAGDHRRAAGKDTEERHPSRDGWTNRYLSTRVRFVKKCAHFPNRARGKQPRTTGISILLPTPLRV